MLLKVILQSHLNIKLRYHFPQPNSHPDENLFQISNDFQHSLTVIAPKRNQVLLATALIPLYSESGELIQVRALFDNGSQSSFITEHLVNKLRLKVYNVNLNILGLSQSLKKWLTF